MKKSAVAKMLADDREEFVLAVAGMRRELDQFRSWANKTPERRLADDVAERDKLVNAALDRVHIADIALRARVKKIEDQNLHERLLVLEGFKTAPEPTTIRAAEERTMAELVSHRLESLTETTGGVGGSRLHVAKCTCGNRYTWGTRDGAVNNLMEHVLDVELNLP